MKPHEEQDSETLRGRLRDAIRECRRQIDILTIRSAKACCKRNDSREIALLEDELKRLREALAGLGESESER